MTTKRNSSRNEAWTGSKWIRPERRLAIYLRDGLACCYCGEGIEQGATLSLDHVKPHSHGGSNDSTNLVTACKRCNSARGNRSVKAFSAAVAEYLGRPEIAAEIRKHIKATAKRTVDVAAAKALIAQRGSYSAALNA